MVDSIFMNNQTLTRMMDECLSWIMHGGCSTMIWLDLQSHDCSLLRCNNFIFDVVICLVGVSLAFSPFRTPLTLFLMTFFHDAGSDFANALRIPSQYDPLVHYGLCSEFLLDCWNYFDPQCTHHCWPENVNCWKFMHAFTQELELFLSCWVRKVPSGMSSDDWFGVWKGLFILFRRFDHLEWIPLTIRGFSPISFLKTFKESENSYFLHGFLHDDRFQSIQGFSNTNIPQLRVSNTMNYLHGHSIFYCWYFPLDCAYKQIP